MADDLQTIPLGDLRRRFIRDDGATCALELNSVRHERQTSPGWGGETSRSVFVQFVEEPLRGASSTLAVENTIFSVVPCTRAERALSEWPGVASVADRQRQHLLGALERCHDP